jgi:DDE superfamily endonuclease
VFSSSGWRYFQGFIAGLLLCYGRKTVTRIASTCFFVDKSLASWERFLADAQWSLPHVTEQLITLLFSTLGHQLLYAGYYLFALDTTYVPKRKGRMLGVQRWTEKTSSHDAGVTVVGHHWAIGGFLHRIGKRWQALPAITRLISGQNAPSHVAVSLEGQAVPQCFWDSVLAVVFSVATLIRTAPFCVVCDAYFSKAPFINPLLEWGIHLVSRLRHDVR